MPQRQTSEYIEDLEEAFRIVKVDEETYVGAHPLRLPIGAARGVYGGNTIAQALLVGITSSPADFTPLAFHSYFIGPGKASTPMTFKVLKINDDGDIINRSIHAIQDGEIKFTALVTCIRKGAAVDDTFDFQKHPQPSHHQYRDPGALHTLRHTDYIRNAYTDEFVDPTLVPEEKALSPADRWINIWSGIHQHNNQFKDPRFGLVGIGGVSDSAFLTTLARVLHAPWNPTETKAFQEVDLDKDAKLLMNISLNMLHIFHYNAMSLDHHIYFHTQDSSDFDICNDWLTFNYQARRVSNNRTLVRGYFYNKSGKKLATVAQEGLTLAFKGFDTIPEETTNYKDFQVKL
ncbi:Thioesterase/thiol ester dehydrase-isomerase [Yamadazyma tenuis ATCC 10573]|uniref:Thioesterase/thiol ester dehydrase-isomerase n=1 Tax=Candida tenuis (strain ATCC 10573 / BCRC 21748 / CBS 615 / JCM 9827 / NBRC 10315 / NRRL Y-1498 / VKM Y-70) TaxID=590646 RepID=G3B4X0_CANTC|nr:Thioesterase/thiol ester dehydrase-isomerase [Yamadazyma tenuis ATCC 10573]EGV64009.1 Thioesterase/thiol ester dehydrase-isomerase [Yamadazyma tenuis ATCC 10573]